MKVVKKLAIAIVGLFFVGVTSYAQEGTTPVTQYNEHSVSPIPKYEQLYKQRIWTRIDLEQKQNKGFFSKNSELSKILMDAVKNDLIQNIYFEDSLNRKMSKAEFILRLNKTEEIETQDAQPIYENDFPYFEGDIVEYQGTNYISMADDNLDILPDSNPDMWELWAGEKAEQYFPTDITWLEIMEDVIFDKRRSRQFHDVQSIKLIVPGKYSNDGANYVVAVFAYKDIVEFSRANPDIAIWYNQYNSAENRNIADAFLLRLFHGDLYKVENPDNLPIASIYEGSKKEGIMASKWLEMQMLEREHHLWSS